MDKGQRFRLKLQQTSSWKLSLVLQYWLTWKLLSSSHRISGAQRDHILFSPDSLVGHFFYFRRLEANELLGTLRVSEKFSKSLYSPVSDLWTSSGFGLNFSAARPSVDRCVFKIKVFSSRSSEWCSVRPSLNYFKSTIMADSVDPSQSDQVLRFGLNHTHMVLRNIWLKHLAGQVGVTLKSPDQREAMWPLSLNGDITSADYLIYRSSKIKSEMTEFQDFSATSLTTVVLETHLMFPCRLQSLPGRWRQSEGLNLPPVWITLTQNTQKKNQFRFLKKFRAT